MMKRFVILLLLAALVSCERPAALYEYRSTPLEGWESADTLVFTVDSLREEGIYSLDLLLRTSTAVPYPFRTLWLVVKQNWHSPAAERLDTLACELVNADGDVCGDGVLHYRYRFPVDTLVLPEGAQGRLAVCHIMRRESLKGISDVGLVLKKELPLP